MRIISVWNANANLSTNENHLQYRLRYIRQSWYNHPPPVSYSPVSLFPLSTIIPRSSWQYSDISATYNQYHAISCNAAEPYRYTFFTNSLHKIAVYLLTNRAWLLKRLSARRYSLTLEPLRMAHRALQDTVYLYRYGTILATCARSIYRRVKYGWHNLYNLNDCIGAILVYYSFCR